MRTKTQSLYSSLCKLIPGGVNSPVRAFYGIQDLPLIIKEAKGDILLDVDSKEYIDFCASWGAMILGHSDQEVTSMLAERLLKGTSYGVTCDVEKRAAELVQECFPSMEKMRFCSSGTESTMYALRLARGYTNRDYILKFVGNYHGNADFLLTKAGSGFATFSSASKGVPKESIKYTLNVPYNDEEAVREVFNQYKGKIAAVIVEPIAGNMGLVKGKDSFLKLLREITSNDGALLIFDEVISGFRASIGGAQLLYKIKPDLTCLGKIVGGGFPAACFGGKKEIMDCLSPLGDVHQAGTLSGNPMAMEAGYQVIKRLMSPGFYEELNQKTVDFLAPIEAYIKEKDLNVCLTNVGSMFTLFFGRRSVENMEEASKCDPHLFNRFFKFLFERGIYFSPSMYETCFLMQAHTKEHLNRTQGVILEFLQSL